MKTIEVSPKITLKEILYLTDFSLPSKRALPFAVALARHHDAIIRALHVLVANRHDCSNPALKADLVRADTEIALTQMQALDSAIEDVTHQAKLVVQQEEGIWPAVEEALRAYSTDLIVVGTHGRIGSAKQWFGSVAEEILRRSIVPVLTIGPCVSCRPFNNDDRAHRLLFATNFGPETNLALEYACSFAEENGAQLLLLHVINRQLREQRIASIPSVAEAMHKLYELIPGTTETSYRCEAVVRCGEPAKQIIEMARERCADLIVMAIRDHTADLEYATHFETTTAHKVLAGSPCPVLTIRSGSFSDLKILDGKSVN